MSKREIAHLLRRLFAEYRRRFHERAPKVGAPVPLLGQKRVDVVTVNGGRALHFFFSQQAGGKAEGKSALRASSRRITRLHDVTVWPPTARQQKRVAREGPGVQRDLVRRVARIQGDLYVHFVLYPEDGGLFESIGAVGARLAERELARFEGAVLDADVPDERVVEPAGAGSSRRAPGVGIDPTLRPAP